MWHASSSERATARSNWATTGLSTASGKGLARCAEAVWATWWETKRTRRSSSPGSAVFQEEWRAAHIERAQRSHDCAVTSLSAESASSGSYEYATASSSAGSRPACSRHQAAAHSGSSQVENATGSFPCLRRLKRSSSAAATISPSTTRAAAGSWNTPLIPRTFTTGAGRPCVRRPFHARLAVVGELVALQRLPVERPRPTLRRRYRRMARLHPSRCIASLRLRDRHGPAPAAHPPHVDAPDDRPDSCGSVSPKSGTQTTSRGSHIGSPRAEKQPPTTRFFEGSTPCSRSPGQRTGRGEGGKGRRRAGHVVVTDSADGRACVLDEDDAEVAIAAVPDGALGAAVRENAGDDDRRPGCAGGVRAVSEIPACVGGEPASCARTRRRWGPGRGGSLPRSAPSRLGSDA
jgi:hypothetical protein